MRYLLSFYRYDLSISPFVLKWQGKIVQTEKTAAEEQRFVKKEAEKSRWKELKCLSKSFRTKYNELPSRKMVKQIEACPSY